MAQQHSHGHGHAHHGHSHGIVQAPTSSRASRALIIALCLTTTFMVVEAVAGFITNSLALLADAGHMLSDAASLSLALFAILIGRRPRSKRKTFGYKRLEVLAAMANGAALGVLAILIAVEAVKRWQDPPEVLGEGVIIVGVVGLLINLTSAFILHRGGGDSVNVRAALAHVLGDALGSVAAIASGILVVSTGNFRVDPILSLVVAGILLWGAWRILGETVHILMEGTPEGMDVAEVERLILEVPGVGNVHGVHIWSITSGEIAVTAHVVLASAADRGAEVAMSVRKMLVERYHLHHVTIQPERLSHGPCDNPPC